MALSASSFLPSLIKEDADRSQGSDRIRVACSCRNRSNRGIRAGMMLGCINVRILLNELLRMEETPVVVVMDPFSCVPIFFYIIIKVIDCY